MTRPRVSKLIQNERELMLKGKGAVESAREQLKAEEAEQHYESLKRKRSHPRYVPSNDERIGKWASHTANVLYNRKKKRGKV